MAIIMLLGHVCISQLMHILCILFSISYLILATTCCGNSYMLSSKVGKSIYMGLNVYQYSTQIQRSLDLSSCYQYLVNGVGVYMIGRISAGELISRSLPLSVNGLSVTTYDNTILDYGYVSLCSDIGVVGVKVGIIL